MTEHPRDIMLNPVARVLWRAPDVVQLELGAHAVLVEGVEAAVVRRLVRSRQRPGATPDPSTRTGTHTGTAAGTPQGTQEEVSLGALDIDDRSLEALSERGYLWSGADPVDDPRLRPPAARLGAELGALSARHGEKAAALLAARRRAAVAVHGTGRVAAHLAALLAAAGVGRLHVVDAGDVHLHHAVPGGVSPADEGHRFAEAVTSAILRAAPDADTTPLAIGQRPDLVVLAFDEPIDSDRRAALHARGCTHLTVRLAADHGAVGPMVIPGLTSCLRCADLHRRDRDPAWPALAVQLTVPRPAGPVSDVALATTIAGVAAAQILTYLDGGQPSTIEGTLELHLPDWRIRRRTWPLHAECDCTG
ncbi:MAG: ThiF family adenylyltransferase [Actinomycetota bacterium]|nr:ThiF family adenylyltransferase [Actinomycetota bacterium]